MADVKMLGKLSVGDEVQIDGVFYFINEIEEDAPGNLTVTFNRYKAKR